MTQESILTAPDPITLRYDARRLWLDMALSVVFVIAGFYLAPPGPIECFYYSLLPFAVVGVAMFVLAWRLVRDERGEGTATLYYNLPCPRASRWWAHCLILLIALIVLECVAMAGVALNLNARMAVLVNPLYGNSALAETVALTNPANAKRIAQTLVMLPQFVMIAPLMTAVTLWVAYRRPPRIVWVPLMFLGYLSLVLAPLVTVFSSHSPAAPGPIWGWTNALTTAAMLLTTIVFVINAAKHWLRLQIGETL